MRKLGFSAECVEHRRGSFIRVDLFGVGDVLAFNDEDGIILIQAYHKKEFANHHHLNTGNEMIKGWLEAGGKFEHHLWHFSTRKGRKFWTVERMKIKDV